MIEQHIGGLDKKKETLYPIKDIVNYKGRTVKIFISNGILSDDENCQFVGIDDLMKTCVEQYLCMISVDNTIINYANKNKNGIKFDEADKLIMLIDNKILIDYYWPIQHVYFSIVK